MYYYDIPVNIIALRVTRNYGKARMRSDEPSYIKEVFIALLGVILGNIGYRSSKISNQGCMYITIG